MRVHTDYYLFIYGNFVVVRNEFYIGGNFTSLSKNLLVIVLICFDELILGFEGRFTNLGFIFLNSNIYKIKVNNTFINIKASYYSSLFCLSTDDILSQEIKLFQSLLYYY